MDFFSPKVGYAVAASYGLAADELKNMVRKLHLAGIEVILDVVFDHTAGLPVISDGMSRKVAAYTGDAERG